MMPSPSPRNILLVDDHELVRFGMAALLRGSALRGVIGLILEAQGVEAARAVVNAHRVDLALVDLNLADSEGLESLRRMRALCAGIPLAVVSGSTDVPPPAQLRALGADAWFTKSGTIEPVLDWVRQRLSPPNAGEADPGAGLAAPYRTLVDRLGPQQRVVFELLLDGQPNSRIAEQTGLTVGTVKNYVSMILGLFDADSRAQLIARLRG